jgi:hypothetical protein
MTIGASSFTERKEAGAALIEACRKIHGVGPDKVGNYRGFEVSVSFDTFNKEYKCHLKGAMTYAVPLGSDPSGNIIRIDNALEKISTNRTNAEAKLETLYTQVENAKTELTRPFPQEAVLAEKSARLAELDSLLSLDGRDEPASDFRDSDIDVENAPEKELAVKDSNAQLSGDETTPQVPPAPQPQYPQPPPPAPQIVPPAQQAAPLTPKEGFTTVMAKAEVIKDEINTPKSPQDKVKKQSHDER